MTDLDLQFGLLGTLVVYRGREPVPVPAARQRVLLASLLLRPGNVVSRDELIETVWDGEPIGQPETVLRSYVLRLRKLLGTAAGRIQTRPGGYLIELGESELDIDRFQRLGGQGRAAGREGSWGRAAAAFRSAMALVRGRPLADVPARALQLEHAPRLIDSCVQTHEWCIDAELRLGRHAELVGEARQLAHAHPLRERVHELLMLALYRSGRVPEALDAFQLARRLLIDELGIEPGEDLRLLHQRILTRDPALALEGSVRIALPKDAASAPTGPIRPVPAQLPADLTDFTGRAVESRLLGDLLSAPSEERDGHAATVAAVCGPGGVGKSTLALHVAHELRDRFPDGQLYADLRGSSDTPLDTGEVIARLLRDLGVAGPSVPEQWDERVSLYRSLLPGRRILIVLDDARDSAHVRPLIPAAAGCCVVVTGRGALTTLPGGRRLDLDTLPAPEARALFERVVGIERASAEPAATASVLAACAGLPLAIRIAGARLAARPGWSIRTLADRLADARTRLAELEAEDLAVRACFTLSYTALPKPMARAFGLLSLLDTPDVPVEVAAALLGRPAAESERLLEGLLDAHLLASKGPGRYGYHDLVRVFAQECAMSTTRAKQRHEALERAMRTQLARLLAVVPNPRTGVIPSAANGRAGVPPTDPGRWIEDERVGLIATVDLVERYPQLPTEPAGGLVEALQRPLVLAGHWADLEHVGRVALGAAVRGGDRATEAIALRGLGRVDVNRGRFDSARERLGRALACARIAQDGVGEAFTRVVLGTLHGRLGDRFTAIDEFSRAIELSAAANLPSHTALAHNYLGEQLLLLGRPQEALDHLRRGLTLARDASDLDVESMSLQLLGATHGRLAEYGIAEGYLREGVEVARVRASRHSEAIGLGHLGRLLIAGGRPDEARGFLGRAADLFAAFGDTKRAEELAAELERIKSPLGRPVGTRGA